MFIISGRLNNSIPEVAPLIRGRNRDALLYVAEEQYLLGADAFDIACSAKEETELDDLCWVIDTVSPEFEARICIDSANPDIVRSALSLVRGSVPIINSTSLEEARIQAVAPLAVEYSAQLVVLLHDERGMPGTTQEILKSGQTEMPDPLKDRLSLLPKVEEMVKTYGLKRSDIFIDPLIFPVSTDTKHWPAFIGTVQKIHQMYPEYHLSGGIDNGSFGLPCPELLNIALTEMHFGAGGDTVMIQLTPEISSHIIALRLLTGHDDACGNYIEAYNKGIL